MMPHGHIKLYAPTAAAAAAAVTASIAAPAGMGMLIQGDSGAARVMKENGCLLYSATFIA